MTDLILRNARLTGRQSLTDIQVDRGVISAIGDDAAGTGEAQAETGTGDGRAPAQTIDLGGRLVTPPLVEPHIHLDAVLTVGQPRPNVSGSLFEGIAVWADRVTDLSYADVQSRVRQVLRWQLACGVQHVRSHVDVCDPELTALRALIDLRQEVRGLIDLQLVAFPQQSIFGYDGGSELMRRAAELGADVVGGIPHYELTREDGVESVKFALALADEHGLAVDIHCDETDDDHSRFVEVMAAETIKRGMSGKVTASHTTAMHSYNGAYAYRVISNIARAGLHMVTNPLDNSVLQGRFDTGPIRRGHTRVKQLLDAGVNVCIGHDSVMDPWYPLGYGDPLQAAFVLVHLGQLSGEAELRRLIEMITANPAAALGISGYGLRVGGPADLVVFDAPSEADALRLIAPRTLVLRRGEVVARATPAQHTVNWLGAEEPVTFLRQ
ncbi:MAG TPA: cytosine deaminase [Streptosporangiaceae bacterium]|nr:cytosine deaminase [Streptosporangiaceae bacterium]